MAGLGAPPARILWGRSLVASLGAEVVLGIVTIALFRVLPDPTSALDIVIPLVALLIFIPAGQWTAKAALGRAIINGALAGAWGVFLYIALVLGVAIFAAGAVPDLDVESSFRPAYLLAHALKIVGGVIGGWLILRKLGQ